MNKIAAYLNEHLIGEVNGAKSVRATYSTDGSILSITPEIVVYPRVTNDIRKVARFTWQLAEKGHVVPVTVRGFGRDTTGAAIGKGIVLDVSTRLGGIIQVLEKDKLVHVRAGASLKTVQEVLKWQGLMLPGSAWRGRHDASVAGVIATDTAGIDGYLADSIERLEVILANGDVIETGRISRREVSRKLGLQTFEGELYRKLEGLFEDNEELINRLAADPVRDTSGYRRVASVRGKDGSFDLTPLFIGSQGTLGIISEVVLRTGFYSDSAIHALVVADSIQTGRDLGERIAELNPGELALYDGKLFRNAAKHGVEFPIIGSVDQVGAVLYLRFTDISERAQQHKLKKLAKLLNKIGMTATDSTQRPEEDFIAIADCTAMMQLTGGDDHVAPPLLHGAFVPTERREEFEIALEELASKHHVELPVALNLLTGIYDLYPPLKLDTVGDKQKLFKLLADYAVVVDRCGGALQASGAEGRLKANAAWSVMAEDEAQLYDRIREIFDPFGTLNPGVKQKGELRNLVGVLRARYEAADL